ncbi:MAG: tetratricopeptide repeat protein [Magnetococcales bacterium]|nr:tetratricopeptide repeat protein [Magnetococcales bacterium]
MSTNSAPSQKPVFISHSSVDDAFVQSLRQHLQDHGVPVWEDASCLSGGVNLPEVIFKAIRDSQHFIVVVSEDAMDSEWVVDETELAMTLLAERTDGFKVVPILLGKKTHTAARALTGKKLAAIRGQEGVDVAMPEILAALGKQLPEGYFKPEAVDAPDIEELTLELENPRLEKLEGKERGVAEARLIYQPSGGARAIRSAKFKFTAPIGPIEADKLRWYLEDYYLWPTGPFKTRAEEVERALPEWGAALYWGAVGGDVNLAPLASWERVPVGKARRFSVYVDDRAVTGADEKTTAEVKQAATTLMGLPWELAYDQRGYLFQGAKPARVRRLLPNELEAEALLTEPPIRILLASPRPDDDKAGYIDHRISARPLVEALAGLGGMVEVTVLEPPTFPELKKELKRARQAKKPYHVVHFDGHGVYDPVVGLGGLCFEDPEDAHKLQKRGTAIINAQELGAEIQDHRIALFFLEACQTAQAELDPIASVAGRLLECGVASVVAMSHSVLVETARRFVEAFYQELAGGHRIGEAMLAGQIHIYDNPFKFEVPGAGDLHLQDWFVPVLYQEAHDPQLVTTIPAEKAQNLIKKRQKNVLGKLPEPPPHHFVGRSRELLALERLLQHHGYGVLVGQGGEGKTTLGVELARWLVMTNRFERAAFVSLEEYRDHRTILDSLGQQLLPGYTIAKYGHELDKAWLPIQQTLSERATLIVFDNLESALPPPDGSGYSDFEPAIWQGILALFKQVGAVARAKMIFTTREPMPEPFDIHQVRIGKLDKKAAIELVSGVLKQNHLPPKADDPGLNEAEIEALVESVNRHARSLTLLAPEIAKTGVTGTTENLTSIMQALQKKHPNERERSLYASVELSLRRLKPDTREKIKVLGVFHGGANLNIVDDMLKLDPSEMMAVAQELAEAGLAGEFYNGHLRLHPALCPYLLGELGETEAEGFREQWLQGMVQLVGFLSQQQHQDTQMAYTLTRLELPNLLAALERVREQPPEQVVDYAKRVEQLLSRQGLPSALKRAVEAREEAAAKIPDWGHARFESQQLGIERLLEAGNLQEAFSQAQDLLAQSQAAGEAAYPGADYDLAMAHNLLGQVLYAGGNAQLALNCFVEAHQRFQTLEEVGDDAAKRMVAVIITRKGDCYRGLGQLDEAAKAYQEGIELDERQGDDRGVAVGKGQLGTVWLEQNKYGEALKAHEEARESFENMDEPLSVATAWHQIGMVHQQAGNTKEAEKAYKESLSIRTRESNRDGEADSSIQLGNLYDSMGRLEEAAIFYNRAADIRVELKDLAGEGRVRSNLANTLIQLKRYDDARVVAERAIECLTPYGQNAQPWILWSVLHNLEQAVGNREAALQARQKAMELFLQYRRDGGENHAGGGRLCLMVEQGIKAKDTGEVAGLLGQLASDTDYHPYIRALAASLQKIVNGSRDPTLADDPALDYDDAVELKLLLERLRELEGNDA